MDLGLKKLKAVVTGGTRGIGRAIAETLAGEGVDVADGPALKAWIGSVGKEFGGIDIIVANVSALAVGGDEESWRKGFAIDMMGPSTWWAPSCRIWKQANTPPS